MSCPNRRSQEHNQLRSASTWLLDSLSMTRGKDKGSQVETTDFFSDSIRHEGLWIGARLGGGPSYQRSVGSVGGGAQLPVPTVRPGRNVGTRYVRLPGGKDVMASFGQDFWHEAWYSHKDSQRFGNLSVVCGSVSLVEKARLCVPDSPAPISHVPNALESLNPSAWRRSSPCWGRRPSSGVGRPALSWCETNECTWK